MQKIQESFVSLAILMNINLIQKLCVIHGFASPETHETATLTELVCHLESYTFCNGEHSAGEHSANHVSV